MICYLHHNALAHYNSLLSAICKYAVNISCTLSCPRDIINLHTFTGFTCHHLYCIRGLQSKSKQGEDLVRWSQAILVKVGFLKTGESTSGGLATKMLGKSGQHLATCLPLKRRCLEKSDACHGRKDYAKNKQIQDRLHPSSWDTGPVNQLWDDLDSFFFRKRMNIKTHGFMVEIFRHQLFIQMHQLKSIWTSNIKPPKSLWAEPFHHHKEKTTSRWCMVTLPYQGPNAHFG